MAPPIFLSPIANVVRALPSWRLFRNHAAGDAVAGVARGIGLHVVGLGVNHERGASVGEQRISFRAHAQYDVGILNGGLGSAVGLHGEVGHVAVVVSGGIEEAVLLLVRIEVRAGRLEVGRIALGVLMEMQRVIAGRQALHIEFDLNAFTRRLDRGRADAVALGVLKCDRGLLDRHGGAAVFGESWNRENDESEDDGKGASEQAIHSKRFLSQMGGVGWLGPPKWEDDVQNLDAKRVPNLEIGRKHDAARIGKIKETVIYQSLGILYRVAGVLLSRTCSTFRSRRFTR